MAEEDPVALRRRREEEIEQWLLQQEQAAERDENERERIINNNNNNGNENPQQEDPLAAPQQQLQQQQQWMIPQQQQQPAPKSSGSSWLSYRPASFAAFVALLWYALRTRQQYYLAAVYLTNSKWAYVVIGNAVIAAAVTLFDLTIQTFLSGLRLQEAEGLQDFFRWNVTETCLALTMFRSELTIYTALQFVALITIKCLHHVTAQREQHLRMTEDAVQEGSQHVPYIRHSHVKLVFFLLLLQGIDMYVVQHAVTELLDTGPTVKILFAFESAILLVSAWSHVLLWHLHLVDSAIQYGHDREWNVARRLLHPWKEYKATLTFAVELQSQAVNFLFYSTFFAIVLTFYGVPINLFREVYLSFAKFKERLTAFFNYRHLMASMNRFRSATDAELDAADGTRTCIICRDDMHAGHDCKRLPGCAHTFHKSCLREWLVQQQSCPTCRADICAMEALEATRLAAAAAAGVRAAAGTQPQQQQGGVEPDHDGTTAAAAAATLGGGGEEPVGGEPQRQLGVDASRRSTATAGAASEAAAAGMEDSGPLNRSEKRQRRSSSRQQEQGLDTTVLDIAPTLFEVVREAAVLSLDDFAVVTRTIAPGMLVLCSSRRRHLLGTEETLDLLRMPDGWIREDSVRKVCEFIQ